MRQPGRPCNGWYHMTEREILARMRAYVAAHSAETSSQVRADDLHVPFKLSSEDLGPSDKELWAAQAEVGALNPRNPGIPNQLLQSFKKLLRRSLSWHTRSFDHFHAVIVRALEAHRQAIEALILERHNTEIAMAIRASHATARSVALEASRECSSRLEQEFGKRLDHIAEEVNIVRSQIQDFGPASLKLNRVASDNEHSASRQGTTGPRDAS